MRLRVAVGAMAALFVLSAEASAQVSWAGYNWNVDRYDPEKFEPYGTYQGRSDALRILLGDAGFANKPPRFGTPLEDLFYDTQGRKVDVSLHGASYATADLFVPGSWSAQQATKWQVSGLWGFVASATNPGEATGNFPIIAFANGALQNGSSGDPVTQGGRIQVFDSDDGWHVLSDPIKYDGWNTLRLEVHKDRYDLFLNGKLVYSDKTVDTDPTAFLKHVYLNSKVNNTSEYEAFWSQFFAGLLKDPTVFEVVGSVPGMTEYYYYSTIGDLAARRGAEATEHFSPHDYVWAYAGGTTGQFDASGTSGYDGTTYFVRSGVDVIQPIEALRLGLTASGGRAETNSDATGGSANSDNYSIGAYATYATRGLYVDLIGEYAWGKWDVNVPSEGKADVDVKSFVGSAELGTSLYVANGLRLVPNASLLFINSNYDDIAFGNVSVNFDSDSALIGRAGARLEYIISKAFGGSRAYIGASVVKDLIDGNAQAIVSSPAFIGGNSVTFGGNAFEETAVQFNGGLDLKIAKATRIYGDASYITGGEADAFRGSGGVSINW